MNEKQYNVELKKILRRLSPCFNQWQRSNYSASKTDGLTNHRNKNSCRQEKLLLQAVIRATGEKTATKKKKRKALRAPSKPQVVTVPSRRSQVDPRIIEKGLEYLSKMEDGEKRDYLLKRMESIQSGEGHSRRSK